MQFKVGQWTQIDVSSFISCCDLAISIIDGGTEKTQANRFYMIYVKRFLKKHGLKFSFRVCSYYNIDKCLVYSSNLFVVIGEKASTNSLAVE